MTYLGTNKTSDQLFSRVKSPVYQGFGLVSMARIYGLDGIYRQDGTRELIQNYIARGLPVLLQGWFSTEGHFIVLTGYDETGWWVNDPAGAWKGCTTCGYMHEATRGRQIHYSYEAVEQVATELGRPNSYWITVITK